VSIVEVYEPDSRVLTKRHVIADLEQVPSPLQEIDPAVNVNTATDSRPKSSQGYELENRPLQESPRDYSHRLLHHPATHVKAPPDRCTQRAGQ
jgi:hypothetical protein